MVAIPAQMDMLAARAYLSGTLSEGASLFNAVSNFSIVRSVVAKCKVYVNFCRKVIHWQIDGD